MCSSWSKRLRLYKFTFPGKMLISMLTDQNLITVDSKRTEQKLIRLSQTFEPEQKHHQMQMLTLNRLRLKT